MSRSKLRALPAVQKRLRKNKNVGNIFHVVLVSLIGMTENLTKQLKEESTGAHSLGVRTTTAEKL